MSHSSSQVLPDSCIGTKPALLSGGKSESLGLIKVQADEIHSLCLSVNHTTCAQRENLPGFQLSSKVTDNTPPAAAPVSDSAVTVTCNHLQQILRPQQLHAILRPHLLHRSTFRQTASFHHLASCKWTTNGAVC